MENELIFELKQATKKLGFSNIHPVVLNDAGNLIVHLAPYPIVARVIKLSAEDDADFWKNILGRELKVAQHLEQCHIPVVPFCKRISPGPYKVGNTWMTLWEYASINDRKLSICEAVRMLDGMGKAMQFYSGELPRLGAWRNTKQAEKHVQEMENKGYEISLLLEVFAMVNDTINHTEVLVPSHGDAHPKNLVSTKTGWCWIDFEDVSLMPKFWDIASFIGNKLLIENDIDYLIEFIHQQDGINHDIESFNLALRARIIMSTLMNLSLTLSDAIDKQFSITQLSHLSHCLNSIEQGRLFKK
jgi:hypothetical protein